jgi:TRAP-type C4-dicarboxylate transport system permease small subunit
LDRFFIRIEQVVKPLLAALLAFITLGVFLQVVLRYVFAESFLWGEELSLFAFIWCVFLGTAACSWRRTHFAFDAFGEKLTGRAAGVHRLLIDSCVLAVTVLMVVQGWRFSDICLQRMSPALGITLFIPTIVIPISGALMTLVSLTDLARDLRLIVHGQKG